jgi:hypothetical protein
MHFRPTSVASVLWHLTRPSVVFRGGGQSWHTTKGARGYRKLGAARAPCMPAAGGARRSGFFYRPFLSRFYGIQFYGFRVCAVQDSWFDVHARIACMTDDQSARFAWNTACDPYPRAYYSCINSEYMY